VVLPNILLITADEWRGDCAGVAGHPVVKTPNVDRLAAAGTYFARHYAQAAPCGPSRASLYTGLYQMNHRVVRNGTPLDRRHDTIALAARRLGYAPTLFGYTDQAIDPRTVSADSPWLNTYEGILPGFDVALRLPENPAPWLDWLEARGHPRPKNFWDIYLPVTGRSERATNAPPRYDADETETAFLTDMFLDWLAERRDGEPWFAHVSYLRPHPPFVVPEPYNAMYDSAGGPPFRRALSAAEERRQHPLVGYWHDRTRVDSPFLTPIPVDPSGSEGRIADWPDEDFRTVRAIYWGMVSEVDRQIGRVLDAVAKAPGDTVVVLTSDHGEMLGDHWTLGKFGYFDQSFHVPLIIADPRRAATAGSRVDAFTESVDVMPTLLDLAGGSPPGHLDGRSLVPFLEGVTPDGWRDAVHWEFDFREVVTGAAQQALGLDLDSCSLAVLRDARFKYVHFAGMKPLLFDLADDPDELIDRAGDPAHASVRLDCAEKLLAWRARHLDRTLTGLLLTEGGVVDARSAAGER
jgi:arylsulfatase A-like enzyme